MKARERRLKMTSEQKERKKSRDRENARQRRLRKKLDHQQPNQNQNINSNHGNNNPTHSSELQNVGGASNHVIIGNNGVVSLSDVSWLNIQQPSWMMNMKIEPEDYSVVAGIQRRF